MKSTSRFAVALVVWVMFLFGVDWVCNNSPMFASLIIDFMVIAYLIGAFDND